MIIESIGSGEHIRVSGRAHEITEISDARADDMTQRDPLALAPPDPDLITDLQDNPLSREHKSMLLMYAHGVPEPEMADRLGVAKSDTDWLHQELADRRIDSPLHGIIAASDAGLFSSHQIVDNRVNLDDAGSRPSQTQERILTAMVSERGAHSSDAEIAEKLEVTEELVRTQLDKAEEKTGATRVQLGVAWYSKMLAESDSQPETRHSASAGSGKTESLRAPTRPWEFNIGQRETPSTEIEFNIPDRDVEFLRNLGQGQSFMQSSENAGMSDEEANRRLLNLSIRYPSGMGTGEAVVLDIGLLSVGEDPEDTEVRLDDMSAHDRRYIRSYFKSERTEPVDEPDEATFDRLCTLFSSETMSGILVKAIHVPGLVPEENLRRMREVAIKRYDTRYESSVAAVTEEVIADSPDPGETHDTHPTPTERVEVPPGDPSRRLSDSEIIILDTIKNAGGQNANLKMVANQLGVKEGLVSFFVASIEAKTGTTILQKPNTRPVTRVADHVSEERKPAPEKGVHSQSPPIARVAAPEVALAPEPEEEAVKRPKPTSWVKLTADTVSRDVPDLGRNLRLDNNQAKVAVLVSRGLDDEEIGSFMRITSYEVRSHKKGIYRELYPDKGDAQYLLGRDILLTTGERNGEVIERIDNDSKINENELKALRCYYDPEHPHVSRLDVAWKLDDLERTFKYYVNNMRLRLRISEPTLLVANFGFSRFVSENTRNILRETARETLMHAG